MAPREIWYLSCWRKGDYVPGESEEFQHAKWLLNTCDEEGKQNGDGVDEEALYKYSEAADALDVAGIPFLRMCYMEMDSCSGLKLRQEELKLCCILLILACNDIPSRFLDSGYLYKISAEMDNGLLSKYVAGMRQQNVELEEQVKAAWEEYYERIHMTTGYAKPPELHYIRPRTPQPKFNDNKLKPRDFILGGELALEHKLAYNRNWLFDRLYFLQDRLHEHVTVAVNLEDQNRDVLLDEGGISYVQAIMDQAMSSIYQKRCDDDNPMQVAIKLAEQERKVYNGVKNRLDSRELKYVEKIILAMEGFTFGKFIFNGFKQVWRSQGKKFFFYNIADMLLSQSGIRFVANVLLFLLSCAIIMLLGEGILKLKLSNLIKGHSYNKFLGQTIKKQKEKQANAVEIMYAITQYQYHWTLLDRQRQIRSRQIREKQRMLHHSIVQKNAADICGKMEHMLGEDERTEAEYMHLPGIDFSKEPEEVEYYWLPLSQQSRKINMNNVGYEIDAIFGFITNFCIYKMPKLIKMKDSEICESENKDL